MKRPDSYMRCGPGKRPRFAAFDFETDGLGGPVTAVSYMREGDADASYISGHKPETLVQSIFDIMAENHEYTWFAHNAQYEFRYFIAGLIEHKDNVSFFCRTDSDVFMITIRLPDYGDDAVLVMRDSMALWDQTLKDFSDTFCPELPKLKLDFDKVTFDPTDPKHIEYSKRDSMTLLYSLIRFNDMVVDKFDVNLRATLASTGIAAWQRTLESDERYYNHKDTEDYVRSAYYGGLVFLTDTNLHAGPKTFDINSSYPFQMKTHPMPIGRASRTGLWSARHLGIYTVVIKAPDDLIVPIIPKRHKHGIVWPSGIFETTVTSMELRFAVKHGYKVLEIKTGLVWYETCKPFDDFVNKCSDLRLANPGTVLDRVAKRMQNSTYGKYGSKRTRRKIYGTLTAEEVIGAEPWGDFYIREEVADDMQCLPQWSVFITAYARLHLLQSIYMVGPDHVIYGDTDSITLKSGFTLPIGQQYGEWKLDKEWIDFRARGPKVYAGHVKKNGTEVLTGAAKGIPRKQWDKSGIFHAIVRGDQSVIVTYKTLNKFVNVLKDGYTGEHGASRSLSNLSNARSWKQLDDGAVRPRTWQEIERAEMDRKADQDMRQRVRATAR
jgi:hypothetical protein